MSAERPRGRPDERYYVGRRCSDWRVYVVGRIEVAPLAHLCFRSDAAFDWGRHSDGALELAFALLSDAAVSDPPEPVCRAFCEQVLADLPSEGFVLAHGEVALWLLSAFSETGLGRRLREHTDSGRWARWMRHLLRRG